MPTYDPGAIAVAACLTLVASARAQAPQQLRDAPCVGCSLRTEHVATLRGAELEGEPLAMVRLGDGRVLMSFYPAGDLIRSFEPDGTPGPVFARRGQGPGEVSYVTHLQRLPGDSVVAFEAGNARASVFGPGGTYVRSVLVPGRTFGSSPLRAGDMVVNGITARSMTEPLQVLSRDGSIRASMGSREEIELPSRDVAPALRRVTSDGEARIWSSLPTSYEIREWDQKGSLQRWLKRSVDWFPSYFTRRTIDPKAPFPPWIIGMQWLGGDQVAVLTQVAAEGWQRHLGAPVQTPGDGTVYPYWDVDEVHDCLIEIINVQSSEVVLSERIHGYAVGFVDPSHIALYREDSMGNPEVEILGLVDVSASGA